MSVYDIWPIFLLGIAVSFDGFSVGISYGMRGIKISPLPLVLIGSISTIVIYLSSTIGAIIADITGLALAKNIGGYILVGMGCWIIYNAYTNKKKKQISSKKILFSFRIKPLGIIINILKEPVTADFDQSGTINSFEAIFLGLALALDALGAGFGAGMTGLSGLLTPVIIGLVSILFVSMGFFFGKKLGNVLPQYFKIAPGVIILFLGILNIL